MICHNTSSSATCADGSYCRVFNLSSLIFYVGKGISEKTELDVYAVTVWCISCVWNVGFIVLSILPHSRTERVKFKDIYHRLVYINTSLIELSMELSRLV